MTAVEGGDFEEAVRESNRILAVRGQVAAGHRASAHPPRAAGDRDGRRRPVGISARRRAIERVWSTPADVRAAATRWRRIAEADLIVLGPGSLYTSLLPSLLIPAIRDAVAAAPGCEVYVCNVATQAGETGGSTSRDHLEALVAATRRRTSSTSSSLNSNIRCARARGLARRAVEARWPPARASCRA